MWSGVDGSVFELLSRISVETFGNPFDYFFTLTKLVEKHDFQKCSYVGTFPKSCKNKCFQRCSSGGDLAKINKYFKVVLKGSLYNFLITKDIGSTAFQRANFGSKTFLHAKKLSANKSDCFENEMDVYKSEKLSVA